MKFTEAKLEKAVIELFEEEGYTYVCGEDIHKEVSEVLLKEDLITAMDGHVLAEGAVMGLYSREN